MEAHDLSKNRFSDAECVLDYSIDNDLVDDVLSSAKGLQAAADIARERKAAKKEREAKIERLKKCARDLAKLVGYDAMDVDEAIAALESRESKARADEQRKRTEAERKAAKEGSRALCCECPGEHGHRTVQLRSWEFDTDNLHAVLLCFRQQGVRAFAAAKRNHDV